MILKKLTIHQFGPFSLPTTLVVSPDVTVLTGANDTGKSSILRLIAIMLDNKRDIRKRDYNITRLAKSYTSWDQDSQWFCDAEFEVSPDFNDRLDELNKYIFIGSKGTKPQLEVSLKPGDKILIRFYLAPNFYKSGTGINKNEVISVNGKEVDSDQLKAFFDSHLYFLLPNIVYVPQNIDSSREKNEYRFVDLAKELLSIAFEGKTPLDNEIEPTNLSIEDVKSAAENLNMKVRELFNNYVHIKFRFELIEEEGISINEKKSKAPEAPSMLSRMKHLFRPSIKEPKNSNRRRRIDIYVEDPLTSETHLSSRGSGVVKITYLVCKLLNKGLEYNQNIVLLDEPENSLHADLQHMLRMALEGIAQNQSVQVVYATHSPSMINPLRIENLRLLKREIINHHVTTAINNRPFDSNFLSVRTSLGLSPADSLLYAPITIIVEGITEVLCVPFILKRLSQSGVPGIAKSEQLLSFTHFLNGEGSSFDFFCRLAKSQGNKVIIFADGDKRNEIKKSRIEIQHPDVQIILLKEGTEFEEIVSVKTYFQALTEITGELISVDEYMKWQKNNPISDKQMFSKRVDSWMKAVFGHSYSKPEVMYRAIEIADMSELAIEPFINLADAIKKASELLFG
jgi:predicted ATP-dependent endonuclease of OLD family